MNETIFADGISVYPKNDKAPDFVKGHIYINPVKFYEWARNNKQYLSEKGFIKLDIKKSKTDTLYCSVDTYKKKAQSLQPDGTPYPQDENGAVAAIETGSHPVTTSDDETIPF